MKGKEQMNRMQEVLDWLWFMQANCSIPLNDRDKSFVYDQWMKLDVAKFETIGD